MKYFVVLVSLLLVSCSSSDTDAIAARKSYLGQTEKQVVSQLGIPSSSYEAEGKRYLIYTTKGSTFLPGKFTNHPVLSSTYIESECDTIFMLTGGKVVKTGTRGDCN